MSGQQGTAEEGGLAAWPDRGAWLLLAIFSAAVNLLMLTGPLFMLQLYDRVLPSRSGTTLAALFGLICGLYAAMAVLDVVRLRLAADLGARLQIRLDRAFVGTRAGQRTAAPADIDVLRHALTAPGMVGLLDLAWAPLFLGMLFTLHPWLGWAGVSGCLILGAGALLYQREAHIASRQAGQAAAAAARLWEVAAIHSGGRAPPPGWADARARAGATLLRLGRGAAVHTGLSRSFRLFLQSALLALGAWLVLLGQTTPGAMVAATILAARALVPVEQTAAFWPLLAEARAARARLRDLPRAPVDAQMALTHVARLSLVGAELAVSDIAVVLPGFPRPALQSVSFTLRPGIALGVIGPQGAGKSLLLQALAGAVPLASGGVFWAGTALHGGAPGLVGYMPQRVDLIAGTLAANITLGRIVAPAALLRALRRSGLEGLLALLPDGLETAIGPGGRPLSGGEVARVGLARALLGQPRLLLLDDPQAGLDGDGCAMLQAALRATLADGTMLVMTAQRPSAVAGCDLLLALEAGRATAFGPRDAVLRGLATGGPAIVRPLASAVAHPGDAV
jgi:ATP-binding cassette subfamily C protein